MFSRMVLRTRNIQLQNFQRNLSSSHELKESYINRKTMQKTIIPNHALFRGRASIPVRNAYLLAHSHNEVEVFYENIKTFIGSSTSSEFKNLISFEIPFEQRQKNLNDKLVELKVCNSFREYAMSLFLKGGFKLTTFQNLEKFYKYLIDASNKFVKCKITTAYEFNENEKKEILEEIKFKLSEIYSAQTKIEFSWAVTPEIVGGYTVVAGSNFLDNSFSRKIRQIQQLFQQRQISQELQDYSKEQRERLTNLLKPFIPVDENINQIDVEQYFSRENLVKIASPSLHGAINQFFDSQNALYERIDQICDRYPIPNQKAFEFEFVFEK
eukprot:TRINITY_DN839_c2_g1_i1.p1 TRINITY_DN839_c2_g1~~TRINITY_DN839_c2_g1_i1.p1  ORF type:complete len:326 (+),score=122.71 TRINITY_DN839_c2_g1_i1:78-1055(+)